jgi:predicted deacylase
MDDEVKAGQRTAVQWNLFGEVVAEYTSSVDGKMAAYRTDATSDPGNVSAFILFNRRGSKAQLAASMPRKKARTVSDRIRGACSLSEAREGALRL